MAEDRQTVNPELLKTFNPIANLGDDQIEELAAQTIIQRCQSGEMLFRQGEEDEFNYYLLSGEVEITTSTHQPPISVVGGTPDAQRPLAPGKPRKASVKAVTQVEFVCIDADLLDAMLTWGELATPEPEVVMSEEGIITIDKGSWIKKMFRSPTFKNLPPANIEQLLDKLEPIRVEAGQVIIRQGDPGDYFYMIDQGLALVTRQTEEDEDESIEIAELPEGASFGEAALISDKPRNATVSMTTDGVLLRLAKEDFLTLLTQPNVLWIKYEQAQKKIGDAYVWLDVRRPSEFATGHLDGALNIPTQQLHRRANELDKNRIYVCYCDTGRRSSAASFILKQHNRQAYVLENGLADVPESAICTETPETPA